VLVLHWDLTLADRCQANRYLRLVGWLMDTIEHCVETSPHLGMPVDVDLPVPVEADNAADCSEEVRSLGCLSETKSEDKFGLTENLAGATGNYDRLRMVEQDNLVIEVGQSSEANIPGLSIDHGKPDAAEVLEDIQHDATDTGWDTGWHQTEVESAPGRDTQVEEGIVLLSGYLSSWVV
jgi:hypothetical protein